MIHARSHREVWPHRLSYECCRICERMNLTTRNRSGYCRECSRRHRNGQRKTYHQPTGELRP